MGKFCRKHFENKLVMVQKIENKMATLEFSEAFQKYEALR
uniref:Uncharacterized protein n=1 Tax=Prochlorococcus marinus str. P0902-H212 TaxID=1620696 RepID=A0A0D5A1Y7_PROMR|nr:hypothetical protein FA02_0161 [Prochlorococcus marinus str. P0902-H212]